MRRFLLAGAVLAGALWASAASAAAAEEFDQYRIESLSAELSSTQAGAHPDFTTTIALSENGGEPYAFTRDVIVRLPAGIFGNPQAFPTCTTLQLGTEPANSECPQDSQVGAMEISVNGIAHGSFTEPIYNMKAPGGDVAARFGFYAAASPLTLLVRLDPETDELVASVEGAPASAGVLASAATFWGVPADPVHDVERITPAEALNNTAPPGGRPSTLPEVPFMTNPTSCGGGREVSATAISYQLPEAPSSKSAPFPAITGCGLVGFGPQVTAKPSTEQAASGAGLEYSLSLPTKGLEFANLLYDSEAKRAEVVLPEGMTVNPSEAEGLGVCSEGELAGERYDSPPSAGCPETSKIGSVVAESPVVDRRAEGSLFLAKPYQNPFGSLLALYMVVKIPDRGVLVKMAGEVSPDPQTGQLRTVFDDIPQLPVSSFKLHFREGARAPLVTPPSCGTYEIASHYTPWASPGAQTLIESPFQISAGVDHGPCPRAGVAPFHPGFEAGSLSNDAGSYSPFVLRLTRKDGEQDLTKFSTVLPPGVLGKLAGPTKCPEAGIARATARTGPHGAEEELNDPSCPASSKIGRTLAGAGVGSVLTYVPGSLYLAGPYHGDPLSVVAVTPGKAGPFDVGDVVVREALTLNPRTAEVEVDGAASDPIPHILKGIPLSVRDVRVYADRPGFTLNPTDCEPSAARASVFGSFLKPLDPSDDVPVGLSSRFQAANCAALGFKPKLRIHLAGGARRGSFPAFTATYLPRSGDANLKSLVLRLPHSEFIEQGHFRTICTRVQFAAGAGHGEACPEASVYGHIRAITPLLDEPLEGPVFLRSSNHNLPDLVFVLHGIVDVETSVRVDSVKGGLRARLESVPDAPLSSAVVQMQGGGKGLIVNSTNICIGRHLAKASLSAQSGKGEQLSPPLRASCKRAKKHKKHSGHHPIHAGKGN